MGGFETAVERSRRVDDRLKALAELKAAALVGCEWCMDFGSWLSRGSGVPVEAAGGYGHSASTRFTSSMDRSNLIRGKAEGMSREECLS